MSKRNEGWGCLFSIIFVCVFFVVIIPKGNDSDTTGTNKNNYWYKKRIEYEQKKQGQKWSEGQKIKHIIVESQDITLQPAKSSGSPRNNYSELWDECEDLESALSDAGIDHEDLCYPIDYHNLEDLRDEYLSLLEENGIDY